MAFSSFNSIQTFIRYVSTSVSNLFNFPAVDPSLVLYYPFDSSLNSQTPNFASGTAVYDASFVGNVIITKTANSFITGLGDLSLNNTMASNIATNYVVSENTFDLAPSGGLTISFWVACNGVANTTSTAVCLPLNNTGAKLEIDIFGSNMIYSNVTTYFSNGYNSNQALMDFSGNNMYVPNFYTNTIIQTNLNTGKIVNTSFISASLSQPIQCIIYNNVMYVLNLNVSNASGYISTYNLSTGAVINAALVSVNTYVNFFKIYGGFIYVSNAVQVQQYNLSTGVVTSWIVPSLNGSICFDISGNYMYIAQYYNSTVVQVNLTTAAVTNSTWLTLYGGIVGGIGGLIIYGNYMYISNFTNRTITKVNLVNAGIVSSSWASGFTNVYSMNIYNNYLYAFDGGTQSISKLDLPVSDFNELVFNNSLITTYNYNTAAKCTICYSMRLIISSYGGPIINVTRSSDSARSDFYTDPSQTYFTSGYNNTGISYSTWIGASTAYVNIWYDQSGKGNHAIQTTAINRPQITTQNSKYAINFLNSGSNVTYLNITTPIQPNTIFTYFYPTSQYVNTIVQTSTDYSLKIYGTPTSVISDGGGDWYYASSQNSGGTQVAYVNNISSTTNIPLGAWTVISLSIQNPYWVSNLSFQKIAYDINAGRALNGYMTEMIFHNTTMTATDMQQYYSNRLF